MKKKRAAVPAPARRSLGKGGFINLRASITLLVCGAAACSMLSGVLLAFFRPEAPANSSQGTLTFAKRVAYQRAIEEVYWRHRIWPKERVDPKPSLDAVMSQAQLEKKVADYLRNSQVLEDYYHQPITAEQLQAEMDRMANHTKQPEVLHEIFAALGNDPFVIAECLARPILSERLKPATVERHEHTLASWQARAETQGPATIAAVSANYMLPQVCSDDTWTPTSLTNAPAGRSNHTAVWTGSEMIVWGGTPDGVIYSNTGGRYNPSTDSWTATSTANAPDGRWFHTAVWTGSEMIIWGGDAYPQYFNTGGRYNPSTDSWTATSTANAPAARSAHTAVWTGSQMTVWGGFANNSVLDTGGRYNPSTDSWTATSTTGAPVARDYHTAVWTGSQMIVWGGLANNSYLDTGGRYNPSTDSWTATSTTTAPTGRYSHTAVWTGSQMIVWGGTPSGHVYLNTGARYDPSTDNWTATSTTSAPAARQDHTAVWTGSEMIVWGGRIISGSFNTGGRYNPRTDSWTATSTTGAPNARWAHTAVWTGSQMIIWGGGSFFNTGGKYCAVAPGATATPTPTPTCPTGYNYTTTTSTGTITQVTTDTGNHCDDCMTPVTFPFPISFYGTSYTGANLNSNGDMQFANNSAVVGPLCPYPYPNLGPTIFLYQEDLRTDVGLSGCVAWPNGCGIFTGVSGTAPNRVFNIEWHAVHYWGTANVADVEIRFYENAPSFFDVFYSVFDNGSNDGSGVQASATGPATTYSCLQGILTGGLKVTYTLVCPSPTATPTATFTPTATATATGTATPTGTPRPTPTPRPNPTPRGRPTPPPRP